LYYDDRLLVWPKELAGVDVAAISIGQLEKSWLVGFTINDNGTYRGEVFSFDGQSFVRLSFSASIRSEYFGLFGFGGKEDNFLAVYGAYRGLAYHFHDGQYVDVSRFFDIRLMKGGFKPELIRTEAGSETIWYLYSSTIGRTRFAKLWQNRSSEISGLASFGDFISGTEDYAVPQVKKAGADKIIILFKTSINDREKWIEFVDQGFDSRTAKIMQTIPIPQNGAASEIIIKEVARLSLDLDPSSVSLVSIYFSVDGRSWQKLTVGNNFPLETPKIRYYYLKVVFSGVKDSFYSPFLDTLYFDYYCQK
jgi:hypothetical protein